MPTTAELYDADFVRWSEEQAKALRDAAETLGDLPLDWQHLAEEVESLGLSHRREIGSRAATIIEHLLKLEHSPATDSRRGWIETIIRERSRVEAVVEDNPSLRRELPDIVAAELRRTKRLTLALLANRNENDPAMRAAISGASYSKDEVLGSWLPPRRERS